MLQLSALRELHSGEASVKLQGTKWEDVACAGGSRAVERARLLWNLRGPSSRSHQKEGGFTKRRGSEEIPRTPPQTWEKETSRLRN